MTHHRREHTLTATPPDTRNFTNQPTSSQLLPEDMAADIDDPPDDQARTPRPRNAVPDFSKALSLHLSRKESVLTQMLSHSSDNNTEDEELGHSPTSRRGFSTTSTWSNPSLTDDNGMTSPGTRATTPSPPPPANLTTLGPIFNTKPFDTRPVVIKGADAVDPLDTSAPAPAGEQAIEAALGRKRVCMFACGKKDTPPKAETTAKKASPPKRKSMLTFNCPLKQANKEAQSPRRASTGRRPSPAPTVIKVAEPIKSPSRLRRSSVSSDASTSKGKDKTHSRSRRLSTAGAADTEATERFCMSNEQRTEDDDWMKERTCHRSRLTVDDTLSKELDLRKLGKEAEEEDENEDEAELDNEGVDDEEEEEDDVDDEDGAGARTVTSEDHDDLDDGFDSDDEAGMGDSSDEEDSGSDYEWWAPGRSTAATSFEHLDQMHFTRQRNFSGSSIGSACSTRAISGEKRKPLKKRASIPIKRNEPDLPDSTDFVCGTLDEDRPMEEAYKQEIEARRAAQHVPCPQDIDPTFPTSDPEMDEEDDDDVFDNLVEESDMHVEGVFGNFEAHEDKEARGRSRKSPMPSPPKRVHSPAPKRVHSPAPKRVHSPAPKKAFPRSPPPPRKLFGSPPKRQKSPAPAPRLRSPPPTRRPSFARPPSQNPIAIPIALAERPYGAQTMASSLPRRPNLQQRYRAPSPIQDLENDDAEDRVPRPARGAIDIVKGLEKKRQFRREKLYRKYCWQRANGESKRKEEKKCVPGKGAEKMREMGLGLAGRWKGDRKYNYSDKGAQHILSL